MKSDTPVKEKLEKWLMRDNKTAITIRIINLLIRFATCVLYIVQIILENNLPHSLRTDDSPYKYIFNGLSNGTDWSKLARVYRNQIIQDFQIALAMYGLAEAFLYLYISYNKKHFQTLVTSVYFVIEMITTVPWIFEMTIPRAKDMFIPVFLNCWVIKRNLEQIFHSLNNMNVKNNISVVGQHLISLIGLFGCLIFTNICGFEYLQRADYHISLFDSFYFTIITFSTVGYGDIVPTYWLSKLFISLMIVVSLVVLPTKIERLLFLWLEKKSSGGSYPNSSNKHVVVCLTDLQYDFLSNFLNEFYHNKKNQYINIVIFSTSELTAQLKQLLRSPLWNRKVYYINGSAMRDNDLERAKVSKATAVFMLTTRGSNDKDLDDQHTILRSWAIKDFAPNVPQFVQLSRTENKIHLDFAEQLVCEDEFKYAILANNCICPGISTLITLLTQKVTEKDKEECLEPWQKHYGKFAGNEIHSIIAENSRFFEQFIGKPFPFVSYAAHQKYGVCLIGIETNFENNMNPQESSSIIVNPGPDYKLKPLDKCFYISIVKEQNYNWKTSKPCISLTVDVINDRVCNGPEFSARKNVLKQQVSCVEPQTTVSSIQLESENRVQDDGVVNIECQISNENQPMDRNDENLIESSTNQSTYLHKNNKDNKNKVSNEPEIDYDIADEELIIGRPPTHLYIASPTSRYKLLREPKKICCLHLHGGCEHRPNCDTYRYVWHNKCIIVAAENATNGIFNFILPLRAKVRLTKRLRPIVLLLENRPSTEFLESICSIPLVYWLLGNISNTSTLLKAGIQHSEALVVVSTEVQKELDDESLYDSSNIFAIRNIHRLFPKTKIVAELRKTSNIRFMKYRAKYMEKEKLKKTTYIYKVPFTSGSVFSASMIDNLLYQAYERPYLIDLVRLLIGVDYFEASGYLAAIRLSEEDMWIQNYGNLYKKLSMNTGEIPIGIYRTIENKNSKRKSSPHQDYLKRLLYSQSSNNVRINIESFELDETKSINIISYVLVNPSCDLELNHNDIIYLLKPGVSA